MVKCFIESIFAVSVFFSAALFMPQAMQIHKTKHVSDLSKTSFLGFNIIQAFTILHAYIHDNYALMFGFMLSLCTSGIVSYLIFLYDGKCV